VREAPAKGADLFGERVRARIGRRKRPSRRERAEAEQILQQAGRLASHSERAFDAEVETCAERMLRATADQAGRIEAFAIAYEAVRRETGLELHLEQVIGAILISKGCCAEMATGEGKTITAVLPAALEGWTGRGVHVVTVNDYLARRDAATTGPVYNRLGLSVGYLQDEHEAAERREAYAKSITYAADKQVIFDFLRDRLLSPVNPRLAGVLLDQVERGAARPRKDHWSGLVVQRGLNAAIVDEADSVLIDEAVTPAIIATAPPAEAAEEKTRHFRLAARIALGLESGRDYTVDQRLQRVDLTSAGRERLAGAAEELPPFWAGPRRREELITRALTAQELHKRDDDYVVVDGKVIIVDRSTGRMLDGRQWQLGVHQAVEAKENLEPSSENLTSARVSYQRFFQRYRRLAGMTGTGWEVADELWEYYRLPLVRVPTHRPVIRKKAGDRVFTDESSKFEAVAEYVTDLQSRGRAVLVGTRSVASSERLGTLLGERGVPCRLLNANREAEEAEIIAEAGRSGAVTVATNMAGRGTDILIDERTRELGGLVVVATERHDESRVDRQLYGRSGRQGDPGMAVAFVALDDQLIKRHGLPPLTALCRLAPLRRLVAPALWRFAQWSAGRRAAAMRKESAKADAWIDLAMHHHAR
jgi:preprotein translocase subunit SecA